MFQFLLLITVSTASLAVLFSLVDVPKKFDPKTHIHPKIRNKMQKKLLLVGLSVAGILHFGGGLKTIQKSIPVTDSRLIASQAAQVHAVSIKGKAAKKNVCSRKPVNGSDVYLCNIKKQGKQIKVNCSGNIVNLVQRKCTTPKK